MKNLNRVVGALLALSLCATAVTAQDRQSRTVPLTFVRVGNPIAPFASAGGSGYITASMANGGKGGTGVAVAPWDTTVAIPIMDHAVFSIEQRRALTASATDVDTLVTFGTLKLHSTVSTIDSIKVARDVSGDGLTWTVLDSLPASILPAVSGTILAQPIAGDSTSVKLAATVATIDGVSAGSGAITFYCKPNGRLDGASRLATKGINYIRFRVWMTPGDNVAAGAAGGVSGEFVYPVSAKAQFQ